MDNNKWKLTLLDPKFDYQVAEDGIIIGKIKEDLSINFHNTMPKGAILRELQHQQFHLSNFETKNYNKSIVKFLNGLDRENSVILDLGCGDGRFTELLLEKGFKKIVSLDADIRPLKSLQTFLQEKGLINRVLLIHSSVESIPLRQNRLDAILAIGVLYYLNDGFEKALANIFKLLKKYGTLINSEPDLEGAIYKSIIFETLDDIIENYSQLIFKEEKGDTPYKFRLFTKEIIRQKLKEAGFKIIDSHGISLLPSIIRIKYVRGEISQKDIQKNEDRLLEIFDYLDSHDGLAKHIICKSVKK